MVKIIRRLFLNLFDAYIWTLWGLISPSFIIWGSWNIWSPPAVIPFIITVLMVISTIIMFILNTLVIDTYGWHPWLSKLSPSVKLILDNLSIKDATKEYGEIEWIHRPLNGNTSRIAMKFDGTDTYLKVNGRSLNLSARDIFEIEQIFLGMEQKREADKQKQIQEDVETIVQGLMVDREAKMVAELEAYRAQIAKRDEEKGLTIHKGYEKVRA